MSTILIHKLFKLSTKVVKYFRNTNFEQSVCFKFNDIFLVFGVNRFGFELENVAFVITTCYEATFFLLVIGSLRPDLELTPF